VAVSKNDDAIVNIWRRYRIAQIQIEAVRIEENDNVKFLLVKSSHSFQLLHMKYLVGLQSIP
jgi:hypothetical protein